MLAAVACGSGEHAAMGRALPGLPRRAVIDRVRVFRLALPAKGSIGRCLRLTMLREGRVLLVERSGVVTRSLTIARIGSQQVFGCDKTGASFEGHEWCGASAGILRNGRLPDPRLDILCVDRRGRHVAAAWVNPLPRARWVGVDQGSYTELYPTAVGLPVRIASTRGVEYNGARATFFVTQYGARAHVLSRGRLVAQVAG